MREPRPLAQWELELLFDDVREQHTVENLESEWVKYTTELKDEVKRLKRLLCSHNTLIASPMYDYSLYTCQSCGESMKATPEC